MTNSTNQFVAGNLYSCNSIGDSDCWWHFEVVRRTAKSVWIREVGSTEKPKRKALSVYEGNETCSPLGNYSMSPGLYAHRFVNTEKAEEARAEKLRRRMSA